MSEFSKAYCNLHPHELITNFCTKSQCLVPLCANCICTHTQQHIEENTAPKYENIRSTYKNLHEQIRGKIDNLQNLRKRITKVQSKTSEKRSVVKQVVMRARQDSHQFIDQYFDEKCQELLKEIDAAERKSGLQCESRMESISNSITRQISTLVTASQESSFDGFIEAMPRLRGVILENAQKLIEDLQRQVSENENFSTTISYEKEELKNLPRMLNSFIKMIISMPGPHLLDKKNQMGFGQGRNRNQRIFQKQNRESQTRGFSVDQLKNTKPQGFNPHFNKLNEKNVQSQLNILPYQQLMKNPQQMNYIPRQSNNLKGHLNRSYLNQITFQGNILSNSSGDLNKNVNSKVSVKQPYQQKLSNSVPMNQNILNQNRLSVSRVENSFQRENEYNAQKNIQKRSMMEGQRPEFMKVSLSKKPKKAGLKIINQHIAESDNQSYGNPSKQNLLSQSKIEDIRY